MADTGYEI